MTQARDLADGKFDTDTLVVDAANNRVGVREASPAAPLHVSTAASTIAEIRLTSNNTGSGSGDRGRIAVYSSRNDGTAYEAGRIDIDRSSGTEDKAHIQFFTNDGSGASERLRVQSGGGISFNGDTAAANALDDYETGTFTPTYASGVTSPTYSEALGTYTKIGDRVFFNISLDLNTGTANSSQLKLGGLPYTSHNGNTWGGAAFAYTGGVFNDIGIISWAITANSTQVFAYHANGGTFLGTGANAISGGFRIWGQYDAG